METQGEEVFDLNTNVFYQNDWSRYRSDAVRQYFVLLHAEAIPFLKEGEIIWVDFDPYHPHGKVYGFTKCAITKVETIEGGVTLHFGRRYVSYTEKFRGVIARVTDEPALFALVEKIGVFGTSIDFPLRK